MERSHIKHWTKLILFQFLNTYYIMVLFNTKINSEFKSQSIKQLHEIAKDLE